MKIYLIFSLFVAVALATPRSKAKSAPKPAPPQQSEAQAARKPAPPQQQLWALIDDFGTVRKVIVTTYDVIQKRNDGPWVRIYKKAGKGWHYNGITFTPPTVQPSTYTVISSTVQPPGKTK